MIFQRTTAATVAVYGLCCMSFGTHGLHAQQVERDLFGVVEDGHHEPLRGAVVYLENSSSHSVVTYLTDRSGHFSFKRISADTDYDLWAIFRGQQSKRKNISQFDTHPDRAVTLTIKPE